MRLLRGSPLPQDAPRIREIIAMHERELKGTSTASMREYRVKQIVRYQQMLQEITDAPTNHASRISENARHS